MPRYFTRAASRTRADWYDEQWPLLPALWAPEHIETDTGLLDQNGETIWRAPNPIGFGRDNEW